MTRARGRNPVQQGNCADCGTPVAKRGTRPTRLGHVKGPRPRRCEVCQVRHRRRALYRAYLASALRLALSLGIDPQGSTAADLRQAILAADLGATWMPGS